MKIEKIILNNFRNHAHTVIEFPTPISVITGPNASGKSTIKEAILYALTGEGRNDTSRGDLAHLISYGKSKAEVILTLKTDIKTDKVKADTSSLEITRSRTAKGESLKAEHNGASLSGTPTEIQRHIYQILGTDKQTLAFSFNGALLYTMSPKERKAYIFDLLSIDITSEVLSAALQNTGIESVYWEDLVLLALKKGFHEAEKETVMRRKLAKRECKDALQKAPDEIIIGERKYHLPEIALKSVISHLNILEHEKERLLIEKGRLQAERAYSTEALESSRDKVMALLHDAEAELSTLKEKAYEKEKAKAIAEVNNDTQKHIETRQALAEAEAFLQSKEKLASLDFSAHCPYFSNLPCSSLPQIHERREEVEREIAELKELISTIAAEADQCKEMIQQKTENLHAITKQLERQRFLEERITEYREELSTLTEHISKQKEKEGKNAALFLKSSENKDPEYEIRELTLRIQHGTRLLKAVEQWNTYNEKAKIQKEAQSKICAYDKLAHFFSSSGYMKEVLANSLSPLYERLKRTQAILGYSIGFDEDFSILAEGRPIRNLSESERYRGGIILQDAFLHLTPLRIMAIDEVNILDQPNKGRLLHTLLSLCDDYNNILLFSTSGETAPKPSRHPLITMMGIDKGKVYSIVRKAA